MKRNMTKIMKRYFLLLSALFSTTEHITCQTVTDRMITSWWFNTTNATYNSNLVNVEAVYYTTSKVYVKSTGIPSYYTNGNTKFDASAKTNVFILPRTQTVPTSDANRTYLRDEGNIAVLIDGSLVFSPPDGKSYNNAGIWHQLAYGFESGDFDSSFGHSNPSGTYHHHVKPTPLYSSSSSTHSGIIGYAFDGYPIYGPYAYTNVNGTGAIKRMATSWKTRSITDRTTLPDGSTASSSGPTIASQSLGKYFEDYEYVSGYGDLDRYNGRFCITPEYPSGTYAYFVTINSSGTPEFPYIIGDYFYATPLKTGAQMQNSGTRLTSNTIAAGSTLYSSTALPIELISFLALSSDCSAELKWQSATEVNADSYEVEYSPDGENYQWLTTFSSKGNNSSYTFTHHTEEGTHTYRLKMTDLDGSIKYSDPLIVHVSCGLQQYDVSTYPNPFHSSFTIEFKNEGNFTVNLYDLTGKKVVSTNMLKLEKVDASDLQSGEYIIEIKDNENQTGYMRKIVKM
jgi:hypothetical protein